MTKLLLSLFLLVSFTSQANALSIGGSVGADLPFAHTKQAETGLSAEGFFRQDPYELRFHYGGTKVDTYSILVGIKHFFSADVVRPFIEGAMGPVVVNTPNKDLAYGVKPEVSLGLDIGINRYLSAGFVTRYYGMAYFGSTNSGKFEANHGLSLQGLIQVWF